MFQYIYHICGSVPFKSYGEFLALWVWVKPIISIQIFSIITQGMEVDEPESGDSDPEDEGQPDNHDRPQERVVRGEEFNEGEEEGEESCTEEGHQGNVNEEDWQTCSEGSDEEDKTEEGATSSSRDCSFHNSSRLLHKEELLDMFKAAHSGPKYKDGQLTVGLVSKKLKQVSSSLIFDILQFPFSVTTLYM